MDLQLVVTQKTKAAVYETNIEDLEAYVAERLKEYAPEVFGGDVASLKKARAELNKAKLQLKEKRVELRDECLKPFVELEQRIVNLESQIALCSARCDEIVKADEQKSRDAKNELIKIVYGNVSGHLSSTIPLEKIFNQKWLNKTFSMVDVEKDIRERLKKIGEDVSLIESTYSGGIMEIVRAFYLDCMDISKAMAKGNELKGNIAIASEIKSDVDDLRTAERIGEQKKEVHDDQRDLIAGENLRGLVSDALNDEAAEEKAVKEFAISMRCTERQAVAVKNFLTMQGIVYDTFEELKF